MGAGLKQYTFDDDGSMRFQVLMPFYAPGALRRRTNEEIGDNTAYPVAMTAAQFGRMYWRPQRAIITEAYLTSPAIGHRLTFEFMPKMRGDYRPNVDNSTEDEQARQAHQLLRMKGARVVGEEFNLPTPSGLATLTAIFTFGGTLLSYKDADGRVSYYPEMEASIVAFATAVHPFGRTVLGPDAVPAKIGTVRLLLAERKAGDPEITANLYADSLDPGAATEAKLTIDFAPWRFND